MRLITFIIILFLFLLFILVPASGFRLTTPFLFGQGYGCRPGLWLLAGAKGYWSGFRPGLVPVPVLARKLPGQPGPEITRGYILIISGAKHDFSNQFFALISNFLSGGPYLSGNDSFIKSSSKIHENLNLNSYDPSAQKRIFSFFADFL